MYLKNEFWDLHKHKWYQWFPLTAFMIAILGLLSIQSAWLLRYVSLITTHLSVNIIWQSLTALLLSFSYQHWFFNVLLLILSSIVAYLSGLGSKNQLYLFVIGGYLSNFVIGCVAIWIHLPSIIAGASPGIMALLGGIFTNLLLIICQRFNHFNPHVGYAKHAYILFFITIIFIWGILFSTSAMTMNSYSLHWLGFIFGILMMLLWNKRHVQRM